MGRYVHALQMELHLNKKYLFDVQIPRTHVFRIGYYKH